MAEKLIFKVHIPDEKGGGFITLPGTTETTILDLKEKFLEKARAKLGPGKLDDKSSVGESRRIRGQRCENVLSFISFLFSLAIRRGVALEAGCE